MSWHGGDFPVLVEHLVAKPEPLSWDVAGCMYVAPMVALVSVRTVAPLRAKPSSPRPRAALGRWMPLSIYSTPGTSISPLLSAWRKSGSTPSPTVPIAAVYPLEQVRGAYRALAGRHTQGKIVLHP